MLSYQDSRLATAERVADLLLGDIMAARTAQAGGR